MKVELEVFGDVQLSRELLRVGEHAADLRPALFGIADYWRDLELEQFATEGGSGSGGWEALQASTIAKKRASSDPKTRANADRILMATERMFESWTDRNADHIEHVDRDELAFGSRVPYAKYHQPDPQGRRGVEFSERERRDTVRRLQRYVMTGRVH